MIAQQKTKNLELQEAQRARREVTLNVVGRATCLDGEIRRNTNLFTVFQYMHYTVFQDILNLCWIYSRYFLNIV